MDDTQTLLDGLKENFGRRDAFLKQKFREPEVSQIAMAADQEASQQIDCLSCGNCCRTTPTIFSDEDIQRIAKHTARSVKQFKKEYLIQDLDGSWINRSVPCPFLASDNACTIYEVRPSACASFPHTSRDRFANRIPAHRQNLKICPITARVVDRMQELMGE